MNIYNYLLGKVSPDNINQVFSPHIIGLISKGGVGVDGSPHITGKMLILAMNHRYAEMVSSCMMLVEVNKKREQFLLSMDSLFASLPMSC